MKQQKMLHVKWTEQEEATYYVDKDVYSKAHDSERVVTLKAFEGTYTFNKTGSSVNLDTGVETKSVTVKAWKLYYTPTPA